MSWTVQDLQIQIANEIDQSDDAPTEGGTDWNIRLNALNRALFDWAETYDWQVLKKVHNGRISTATGNASYALPSDYRKLDGFPQIASNQFTPVDPSRNSQFSDSDYYVNLLGNPRDGRVMYIHAGTLSSGASVQFTYWKSPQSLASASDVAEIPDPTYLIQRGLYYLYKGSEDGRFPEAKAEADRILARMMENENTLGMAHADNQVHNFLSRSNFRIGRN